MLKMRFYKHLDWLSRVAIPKDIRAVMDLKEGDKLEINLRQDNTILISKVIEDE